MDPEDVTWDDATRWELPPEPPFRERFPDLQAIIDHARPIAEVYALKENA